MLPLLHLYAFIPSSQFLPLGLVWHRGGRHWDTPIVSPSPSLSKLRWCSRGQCTSLPPSTAHVFSTRHTAYRMCAKGGRTVPRTRSVFVFEPGLLLVLLLYPREPRVVHYKYTPMKRQETSFPQSGRAGRRYTKRGRKLDRVELLLRGASWRGRMLIVSAEGGTIEAKRVVFVT